MIELVGAVRHELTVDDHLRLGETGILAPDARVELIEGQLVEMTPIGPRRTAIRMRLTRLPRVRSPAPGSLRYARDTCSTRRSRSRPTRCRRSRSAATRSGRPGPDAAASGARPNGPSRVSARARPPRSMR
jgi:hypothetical protein